jgi:hypothetical protein
MRQIASVMSSKLVTANASCLVWGSKPRYITAKYTIVDRKTGRASEKTSLLEATTHSIVTCSDSFSVIIVVSSEKT